MPTKTWTLFAGIVRVFFALSVIDVRCVQNTTTTTETAIRPITFRIPRPGESDPHFGFSRSFYYVLEKRGDVKLIRIREPGRARGVTLIRYSDILEFVQRRMEDQEQAAEDA